MSTLYETLMQTSFRVCLETDPIFTALVKNDIDWADADMLDELRKRAKDTVDANDCVNANVNATVNADDCVNPTVNANDSVNACVNANAALKNTIKTIIVRNLPRVIDQYKLYAIFEEYGPVCDIYLPKNMDLYSPHYGTLKGFAIIKFVTADTAYMAYLHGPTYIYGKHVTIEFAKEDR